MREADQHRRQGRQLEPVPDGRGGGATADVSKDPDADCPIAGTPLRHEVLWGPKAADRRWEGCLLMKENDQVPAPQGKATTDGLPPTAAVRGRVSLPRGPDEGQIVPKPRESGEFR